MSTMGRLMEDIQEVEQLVKDGTPLARAIEQISRQTGASVETLTWGWSSYQGADHDDDV